MAWPAGAAACRRARTARRPARRRHGPRARGRPGRARRHAPSRRGAGCRRRPGPGEIRPTYGSEEVLTTSAASGPSGSQVSAGRAAPCGVVTAGRRALQRGREAAGDQLQQLDRAEALPGALGGGRGGQHRVEGAAGDGLLQVRDQRLDVDLLAAEVAVHQGLVLALGDDPLDQPVAGLLDQRQLVRVGSASPSARPRSSRRPAGESRPIRPVTGACPSGASGAVQRQVQRQHGVGVVAAEDLARRLGSSPRSRPAPSPDA